MKKSILLTLLLVLVHCSEPSNDPNVPEGKDDPKAENQQEQTTTSQNQGTKPDTTPLQESTPPSQNIDITCIAGVYSGTGDLRWNSLPFNQNLVVSIAFQGNSGLVKVQGDDGDLLCTHYEGLEVTPTEDGAVVSAARIVSSRTEGNAWYSDTLADSLLDIQVSNNCNFKIGSADFDIPRNNEDETINSENLERVKAVSDLNILLNECGGLEAFTISPPQEEITVE